MNINQLKEFIKDLDDDIKFVWYDEQGNEIDAEIRVDEETYRDDIPPVLVVW